MSKSSIKKNVSEEIYQNKLDALKEYYQKEFSFNEFGLILGYTNFNTREFGVSFSNDQFHRNLSFSKPSHLLKYLEAITPFHFFIGAVYHYPPSKLHPITSNLWQAKELVFDLDLNDYDKVREKNCGCKGKNQMCLECWDLLLQGAYFLQETMEEDFGFTQLAWTFSGRRGLHLWISDDLSSKLDSKNRGSITNYLALVKDERIFSLPRKFPQNLSINKRVHNLLIKPFFEELTLDQKSKYEQLSLLKGKDAFIEEMLWLRYPRIDWKVTIDINRLLRFPGSIHGVTGKKCSLITNLKSFNPFKQKSIYEVA